VQYEFLVSYSRKKAVVDNQQSLKIPLISQEIFYQSIKFLKFYFNASDREEGKLIHRFACSIASIFVIKHVLGVHEIL